MNIPVLFLLLKKKENLVYLIYMYSSSVVLSQGDFIPQGTLAMSVDCHHLREVGVAAKHPVMQGTAPQ